ncbi:probable glutamate receptor [Penaeus chinensis]|uniref:probable glutamate receptor n=1 Tax=Penaeus chinensis TaxID=139456 RepID=UPI001FB699EE|nr:probable glutamate receptor [Penaeus chinensis]
MSQARSHGKRNDKITLAVLNIESQTATLWEAYQINEKLEQRITLVGRWTCSSCNRNATHDDSRLTDVGGLTGLVDESAGESEPHDISKIAEERVTSPSDESPGTYSSHASPGDESSGTDSSHKELGLIPKVVRVEVKAMAFGVLEAPVDDPIVRRKDLTGLHLTCTTVKFAQLDYEPLTIPKEQPDGKIYIDGLYGKIFSTLQQIANFTYTCHNVKDGAWGSVVDGKWTGMIKEIHEGTADIAIAPLSITQLRSTVSDFLFGLAASGFRIVVKRPANEDYMWTVYTKQFESDVWGIIILVSASIVLCLHCVSRWSSEVHISLPDSVFIVTGIIFGQGTTQRMRTTAERTVLLTGLLLQVVALGFYTSNLVSALTVGPPMPPLNDLQDVYNHPSLTFGFLKGSSLTDRLNSPNPLYQAISKRMKDEDYVLSPEEGMERVLEGNYAFMEWEFFYNLNYANECGAFLLPASYFPDYTSFALTKGSPLVPVMNAIVMDILSVGLIRKWLQELKADNDCGNRETSAIELKTVLTPFLLLSVSILLSAGILMIEVYLNAKKPLRNEE